MTQRLDSVIEAIKTGDYGRQVKDYFTATSEIAKKALGQRNNDVKAIALAVMDGIANKYGHDVDENTRTVFMPSCQEIIDSLIYSCILLGVGLAIDEEIR